MERQEFGSVTNTFRSGNTTVLAKIRSYSMLTTVLTDGLAPGVPIVMTLAFDVACKPNNPANHQSLGFYHSRPHT
jgi:hypothetical protein